ncbi:Fe-S cluster assembly transcriptional regulator IscR [Avibacterium paragallinarum]|uniref:HTH-type transcriptional regulator iscR n=1 Tax=Avibacterium paragallinarum TaxID=728 RepID=A0A0F5EY13_AVIPA|nr:Fe-S cluster assembly transcriptional regulator IscR [Avibacterium paragallinarum]AZI14995.1 Fe-S cluster assembly transcriptional regulator IscR [Avibacterium paragallinarum]KAA6209894.1 Fe-S cluster assembly transcriptional regulator IscR [Avibacterium paragallinarum]KKB01416.1 transcriptional regulator [Avibacterium paragallinarum]RZN73530.1 Fe-S cluster assembly transcriptional regulator IscR [Avibacterium paragallinarum]SUU98095.1 HTH-type transcriptional regulator iscR [Avibacterium p
MKLASKGRYAVTAILDIALNAENGPVSLADISERQHISLSYLEQLFAKLRRHGLVKSVRGPGGGYQLGQPSSQISIAMIIAAVNENITVTRCLGQADCKGGKECLTHSLWEELSNRIEDFLNEITIAELVEKHHKRHHRHKDFDNLVMLNDKL